MPARRVAAAVAIVIGCGFDPAEVSPTDGNGNSADATPTTGDGSTADAPPAAIDASPCPSGYQTLPTSGTASAYRYDSNQLGWLAAEEDCENDGVGAHLAVPQTSAEHAAIVDLISSASEPAWMGVTDRVDEGTWLDVTGVQTFRADWFSGASTYPEEPDGSGDCVLLSNDDLPTDERDKHFDENCANQWSYVCECDGIAADPATYTP